MNDKQIFDFLTQKGAEIGAPYHNGALPWELQCSVSTTGWEVLWECGYKQAASELLKAGENDYLVAEQLQKIKDAFGIIESQDIVPIPDELSTTLRSNFDEELPNEPPLIFQRLDERLVKDITEFRVEMYTDESKHRGRPHVAVYLKSGRISVSLDDPPVNLTPGGRHVGEASALRVIKKNRKKLLKLWKSTRVDTQRL